MLTPVNWPAVIFQTPTNHEEENQPMNCKITIGLGCVLAALAIGIASAVGADKDTTDPKNTLPRPDGKPADMSKPVQVYILMGQSNMLGMGKVTGGEGSLEHAVKEKKKYPYLVDDAGKWTERKDVRNVRVMVGKGGGMQIFNNEWMTIKGKTIGPEIGIGHHLGHAIDAPVLILKSCIGNRSLGWDLLPPGSMGYDFTVKDPKTGNDVVYTYAGYKQSPHRWVKGTEPQKIEWYAGKQYDDDVANAKKVLAELDKYYPGATKYEIAGFFWWQGEKDCGDTGHASHYEENLVRLIKQLRKDFNAPGAKFVLATLGEATMGSKGNGGMVLDAQLAVDGTKGKYPEFKGNVATVYANPLSLGGSGNSHYNHNAETYMNVGEAMGRAMVGLIETSSGSSK
jgi:hypothetical protein